ncbi:MAG: hypothetical protein WBW99_18655 [Pseudolabrys sp.]
MITVNACNYECAKTAYARIRLPKHRKRVQSSQKIPEHVWRRDFLVGAKRPDALINNSKCPWSSESIMLQKIVNDPFIFSQPLPLARN